MTTKFEERFLKFDPILEKGILQQRPFKTLGNPIEVCWHFVFQPPGSKDLNLGAKKGSAGVVLWAPELKINIFLTIVS